MELLSTILSMLTKWADLMSVRHALLALLSEGPKYGLQLRQEFEARTGEVWPFNVGQVYTTLQRLERDGLVESDEDAEDGPQKGFRLTPEGQIGAGRVAPHAARSQLAPSRRAGDQGHGGASDAGCRRPRGDPGASPVPGRAHAAVDAPEGGRSRVRPRVRPGRRRRAVSSGRASSAGSTPPTVGSSVRRPSPLDPSPSRCRSCDGEWGCGHEHARAAQGLEGLRRGCGPGPGPVRRRPVGRSRLPGGGDGGERIGQEHAADHRREPRGADQRRGARRRGRRCPR